MRQASTAGGRAARWGWALYDWAADGFSAVIIAFVFSAWFTRTLAEGPETGTTQWGAALAVAGVAAALCAPPAGAVADRVGPLKPWLAAATGLTAAATAALWFVQPGAGAVALALVLVGLGSFGSELSKVFYNAMLPRLAGPGRRGRLSGHGWALGYAGGLACLALVFLAVLGGRTGGAGVDAAMRWVGPVVAGWLIVFSIPLFLLVPDRQPSGARPRRALRDGLGSLRRTLGQIRRHRDLLRFLVARLVYTDGTGTLFAFGGVYAAGTFGLEVREVLAFGVALNVAGGLGALAGGRLDDRIGPRRTILGALAGVVAFGTPLLFVEGAGLLWAFGLPLGLCLGPIQPASRTLLARLTPDGLEAQMFGFFATSGKITAFVGPALVAALTALFGTQRAGMAAVVLFFVAGVLLLLPVDDRRRHG
ncbi:MFS transporter [Rhodovulum sp. 12E13]|nr:MFS transporter [Rhodovulum sp. 12E13]